MGARVPRVQTRNLIQLAWATCREELRPWALAAVPRDRRDLALRVRTRQGRALTAGPGVGR